MLAQNFRIFDGSVDNFGERYENKNMHFWSVVKLYFSLDAQPENEILTDSNKSNYITFINYLHKGASLYLKLRWISDRFENLAHSFTYILYQQIFKCFEKSSIFCCIS